MHTPFCSLPRQGVTTGYLRNTPPSEPSHVLAHRALVGYSLANQHMDAARVLVGKAKQTPHKASKEKAVKKAATHVKAAKAAKKAAKKNANKAAVAKRAEAHAKTATSHAQAATHRAQAALKTAKTNAAARNALLQSRVQSAPAQAAQAAQQSGGGSGSG